MRTTSGLGTWGTAGEPKLAAWTKAMWAGSRLFSTSIGAGHAQSLSGSCTPATRRRRARRPSAARAVRPGRGRGTPTPSRSARAAHRLPPGARRDRHALGQLGDAAAGPRGRTPSRGRGRRARARRAGRRTAWRRGADTGRGRPGTAPGPRSPQHEVDAEQPAGHRCAGHGVRPGDRVPVAPKLGLLGHPQHASHAATVRTGDYGRVNGGSRACGQPPSRTVRS